MRRRYGDCARDDGNCALCSLVNYGRDCHDRPITKLAWTRMANEMDQPTLARLSGVNIRLIQKIENGEASAENVTAKNLIALADALHCHPKDLI